MHDAYNSSRPPAKIISYTCIVPILTSKYQAIIIIYESQHDWQRDLRLAPILHCREIKLTSIERKKKQLSSPQQVHDAYLVFTVSLHFPTLLHSPLEPTTDTLSKHAYNPTEIFFCIQDQASWWFTIPSCSPRLLIVALYGLWHGVMYDKTLQNNHESENWQ